MSFIPYIVFGIEVFISILCYNFSNNSVCKAKAMKNLFCLGRVWYVWVAISLLLSQIAFAQNFTNQTTEIINDAAAQSSLNENSQGQPVSDSSDNTNWTDSPTNNTVVNETANVTTTPNQTPSDETITQPILPVLNIDIVYPQRLIRGETIEIRAVITNTGSIDINNAVISWLLPNGFEIISKQENCSSLASGSSCESLITVKTSTFAELGMNSLKTVVNYG